MSIESGRPDEIVVSTIIPWGDSSFAQYGIVERPASSGAGPEIDDKPVCAARKTGYAGPGVRPRAFARFPHHTVHTICGGDLTPAMREIGRKMSGAGP